MAVAIPFMMYAAAGIAAVGAVKQGQAAQAAATFNAMAAEADASQARSDALAQSMQTQRENVLRLGSMRASAGAGGGTMEGSVLDVLADTAAQGELQRQWVLYQGEARARGYRTTATLDRMQGKAAADAGLMRAGTELFSGGVGGMQAQGRLRRTG